MHRSAIHGKRDCIHLQCIFRVKLARKVRQRMEREKQEAMAVVHMQSHARRRSAQQKATAKAIEDLKVAVTSAEGELDEAACREALKQLMECCTVSTADRVVRI